MTSDDDDKPTVVLDLNALKKQKLKQEEELASIVQDLEFAVGPDETQETSTQRASAQVAKSFTVILFDFQSDFFEKEKAKFPAGYQYIIAKTLPDLNKNLANKAFQIVVFNYDVNPKAVNTLTAQIKQKFPFTKTMIMAKAISPEKAKLHAKTASGAHGYYQFPLDAKKIETEFQKIREAVKKVG